MTINLRFRFPIPLNNMATHRARFLRRYAPKRGLYSENILDARVLGGINFARIMLTSPLRLKTGPKL